MSYKQRMLGTLKTKHNMNTLTLDNYDVVEMDASAMRETDGGHWLDKFIKYLTLEKIVDNWDDIEKGFADGYGNARKH